MQPPAVVAPDMLGQHALGQLHQVVDLSRVALAHIVGRRDPRGDTGDPGVRTPLQELLQVFRTETVTDAYVVVPGAARPAPVAVHHNRDVPRLGEAPQLAS